MTDKTESISPPLPSGSMLLSMDDARRAMGGLSKPAFNKYILEPGHLKTILVGVRRFTCPVWMAETIEKLGMKNAPKPSARPNNRWRPADKKAKQHRASSVR